MATQTEVPGVNNAVSKLEELGSRMRSDDFGFLNSDVSNIDKVIEALHELEQERKKIHDELETETIKASVNRHKLQFLPAQIKDEIMVAVNSARQSNAKAQQELQDKLDNINKNIIELGLTHQELEQENSVLHPERELVRQQHEEIISQLNQRMAEKASMQIALNETRDKVRQANQSIVNLEDGILQLKEDLIQERTEARHEKKRLKKAVADTTEKTRDQREQNMGKKKELDSVQEVLTDSEGKLDALRKSIRRFETSRSRKEEEERNLNAKLNKELKMINQQKERGEIIKAETKKEKETFAMQEDDLLFKIDRFEKDIKEQEELVRDLEVQKSSLQAEVRERLVKKEDDAARVAALDARLQLAKKSLTQKAEEVGRMQAENIDMTEEIETIGESHKAVVAQLNKQLEECREQLNIERKERMDLQSRKESVSKDLEDHKTDQQRFMQSVNTRIQEGKTKHVELSNEGVQIQKDLRKEEDEIRKLQGELTQVEKEYEEMFTTMNNKTKTMESECGIIAESSIATSPDQILNDDDIFGTTPYDTTSPSCQSVYTERSLSAPAPSLTVTPVTTPTGVTTPRPSFSPTGVSTLRPMEYEKQGEIVSMETDLTNKTEDVEVKTPIFQDLEVTFEERTETYDKMKKDVVVLKNKKITLEDAIVKSKRDKETLIPVQAKLREDLKQIRGESLSQMKELGTVMQGTEQQIYEEGSKLRTVLEENQRFQESCRKLEADILDIQNQMEHNEKLTARLQEDLVRSKEDLVKSWESDRVMQEFFATRDKETIEAFGRLLNKTEKRETTISDVTGRLMGELQTLAQFLDNVSSRRPRDTRSGKRPTRSARRPATTSSRGHSAVSVVAAANQSAGTSRLPSLDLNSPSHLSSRPVSSRPTTVRSKRAESVNEISREKSVTVSARS